TAGIDPNHLWITKLEAAVAEISVSNSRYAAQVERFAFRDSGGFRLDNLSAGLVVDSVHTVIDELELRTPYSRIRFSRAERYPSLSLIAEQLDKLDFAIAASESYVGMRDINLVAPMLLPVNLPDTGKVVFEVDASGRQGNFVLETFAVHALNDSHISARGGI